LQEKDANVEAMTKIVTDYSIPIPDWFNLDITEINNNLNPNHKERIAGPITSLQ
jgi:hypothetical protein